MPSVPAMHECKTPYNVHKSWGPCGPAIQASLTPELVLAGPSKLPRRCPGNLFASDEVDTIDTCRCSCPWGCASEACDCILLPEHVVMVRSNSPLLCDTCCTVVQSRLLLWAAAKLLPLFASTSSCCRLVIMMSMHLITCNAAAEATAAMTH